MSLCDIDQTALALSFTKDLVDIMGVSGESAPVRKILKSSMEQDFEASVQEAGGMGAIMDAMRKDHIAAGRLEGARDALKAFQDAGLELDETMALILKSLNAIVSHHKAK